MHSKGEKVKNSNNIALIGSGNAFFCDEGVGLYAAKYLKENFSFSPSVEIVDGGTLGFKLMPMLQEYDIVIIVNTSSDDTLDAGYISVKTTEEFLEGDLIKKTANEVEIAEMLQICSLTENMAEVRVISIAPKDIVSVAVALSEPIQGQWQNYIDTVLEQLKSFGVRYQQKNKEVTLGDILEVFATPSIEHNRGF